MRLSPRRVIVESPFGAPNPEAVARNLKYLRACMKDCLDRGEAPFASHGLYTQEGVLDDWKPDEREKGIQAGFAWRQVAEVTVFYVDLGISGGMRAGLKHAQKVIDSAAFPHTMEYRWLGGEWAAFADPEEIKRILGELTHTVDPTALKQADPHLYSKQVPTDLNKDKNPEATAAVQARVAKSRAEVANRDKTRKASARLAAGVMLQGTQADETSVARLAEHLEKLSVLIPARQEEFEPAAIKAAAPNLWTSDLDDASPVLGKPKLATFLDEPFDELSEHKPAAVEKCDHEMIRTTCSRCSPEGREKEAKIGAALRASGFLPDGAGGWNPPEKPELKICAHGQVLALCKTCDWRIAAGIPRRICIDRLAPAELAIYDAVRAVEEAGADILLTETVTILTQAREKLADYVDAQLAKDHAVPKPPFAGEFGGDLPMDPTAHGPGSLLGPLTAAAYEREHQPVTEREVEELLKVGATERAEAEKRKPKP